MLQKLYLKLLCAKFASNWTNIKQIRKGLLMAPIIFQPIRSQKWPTLVGSIISLAWN